MVHWSDVGLDDKSVLQLAAPAITPSITYICNLIYVILEKHVFTHLYAFFQNHKLLADSQFGFRKQNSCQTALLKLTEKM